MGLAFFATVVVLWQFSLVISVRVSPRECMHVSSMPASIKWSELICNDNLIQQRMVVAAVNALRLLLPV